MLVIYDGHVVNQYLHLPRPAVSFSLKVGANQLRVAHIPPRLLDAHLWTHISALPSLRPAFSSCPFREEQIVANTHTSAKLSWLICCLFFCTPLHRQPAPLFLFKPDLWNISPSHSACRQACRASSCIPACLTCCYPRTGALLLAVMLAPTKGM